MKLMMLVLGFGALETCEAHSLLFKGSEKAEKYDDTQCRIFAESKLFEGLKKLNDDGEEAIKFGLQRRVFEAIVKLFEGDIDGMHDIECKFLHELMAGIEYLDLTDAGISGVYRNLARKSLGGRYAHLIVGRNIDKHKLPTLLPTSYLSLLREYLSMHGLCVCVGKDAATIYPSSDKHYKRRPWRS